MFRRTSPARQALQLQLAPFQPVSRLVLEQMLWVLRSNNYVDPPRVYSRYSHISEIQAQRMRLPGSDPQRTGLVPVHSHHWHWAYQSKSIDTVEYGHHESLIFVPERNNCLRVELYCVLPSQNLP